MTVARAKSPPPARLSFKIARDAPVAVILRQGPSRWVRMIRWDMRTDRFELGQWLHASARSFDLSFDGRYVLCFVQGYRARDKLGTWVAISRPPYFSALAVWKIGDSWGGDCLFLGPRSIFVAPGQTPVTLEKGKLPRGWQWTTEAPSEATFSKLITWKRVVKGGVPHFHKSVGAGTWTLKAIVQNAAYRYTLIALDGARLELPDATCADVDARGRLVESRKDGCMYVWKQKGDGWTSEMLLDTNAMQPEPAAPPEEALRWYKDR